VAAPESARKQRARRFPYRASGPGVLKPFIDVALVKLYAVFSPLLPIALLGREDFMAHFKVMFDQRQRSFTLEPY
jgi:hypothetical protein